ncbi:methyltransferase domain-containing protein [Photobacterium phosphoreum]|jgi:chemotaxis protein methyltransferase CheR|uniref:protein-glutamate O-methyltransferase n=1 Tax=Photobacterium phosphoreum TaxID=659 RepID=A0AAW4ZN77_PHOPO|nr:protein-glutamate O-methyltransferase [Photobacterium phosphoreum]KJF88472.1 chemotaxis protein CheR [Photobacterium phosphoreum]MCD9470615.1 chemotaxis protein CheR [Photobacterium phosphoreum]MCD9473267.1 methyltransferase domain-containing protein [Photobacterium phosphoreum]MCD9478209.1 methyltransferase domain-containing protein [Photobacterium phosphoreum]MCD9482365.1 methyltransferase domain-containing protein [Photobacterium phosphoreum]
MTTVTVNDQDYYDFCLFLEAQCGIVLGDNKQYLVRSRLSPLIRRFGLQSLSDLLQLTLTGRNRELRVAAIDAMTTNETLWFRDTYPYTVLAEKVLPELAANRRPLKIWSAASSSGQEPYSIAMTILEQQLKRPGLLPNIQITATDISQTMLDMCREGVYDQLALSRGLSPDRRKMFFESHLSGGMQVNQRVKQLVKFRPQNLKDSYVLLGKFDVIFCRNVLIYFSAETKIKVLNQLAASLNPGGYLFLGASESLTGLCDRFEMVRCNPGIIYKLK